MTRINPSDHVLLLLREQLRRGERATRSAAPRRAEPQALDRLKAMDALDAMDDHERRRSLVQGLLADGLGDAVANDAGFQTLVEEVARIVGAMPEGQALVDRAIAQLRGS